MSAIEEGIQLMECQGGSFVKALAAAWRVADPSNRMALERHFSYFDTYVERAKNETLRVPL